MAHPQVTAHASGALLGTVGAADLLDLLSQGLEGGVNLHVTVVHHVGVVSAVVASTEGIGSLLLNRLADEVESTTGSSRGSRGSGKSRGTLEQSRSLRIVRTFKVFVWNIINKCNLILKTAHKMLKKFSVFTDYLHKSEDSQFKLFKEL